LSQALSAFYRKSPQVPAKVRSFLRYLSDVYSGMPPWERELQHLESLRWTIGEPMVGAC
jgi:hypothetical protein